jgi:hypothetical protein
MTLDVAGQMVTLTQSGTAPTLSRPKGLRVVKDKKNPHEG